MTKDDIINAWARIRKIDETIPDDVLDFLRDSAIKELNRKKLTLEDMQLEADKWARERSVGDKKQDEECAYDFLCGMQTVRVKYKL